MNSNWPCTNPLLLIYIQINNKIMETIIIGSMIELMVRSPSMNTRITTSNWTFEEFFIFAAPQTNNKIIVTIGKNKTE